MYIYIKHIFKTEHICIQRYLDIQPPVYHGVFKKGHERTWFSNIIYNVPPELKFLLNSTPVAPWYECYLHNFIQNTIRLQALKKYVIPCECY